jgi:hypothetical protein
VKRLTLAAFERSLRAALTSGKVHLSREELARCVAQVNVDHPPHQIKFDPLRGAVMDSIVHELIHVVWNDQIEPWGDLEEPIVAAIEQEIVRFINRSERRVEWWRARIHDATSEG